MFTFVLQSIYRMLYNSRSKVMREGLGAEILATVTVDRSLQGRGTYVLTPRVPESNILANFWLISIITPPSMLLQVDNCNILQLCGTNT